jgi:hypothetical protein
MHGIEHGGKRTRARNSDDLAIPQVRKLQGLVESRRIAGQRQGLHVTPVTPATPRGALDARDARDRDANPTLLPLAVARRRDAGPTLGVRQTRSRPW